ncbi:hypothetical protein [Pseudonocardia sp. H11422]|uniref:hypothetical protein n=1 Tax=Pseudonocardia sp. H11422 TaxID=2835866 RepID=UPI001BDCFF13|nr:hypothetical protein [Pseudonocardia sp. H11422]
MTGKSSERLEWLFEYLRGSGFELERHGKGDSYRVTSPEGKTHPLNPVLVVNATDLDDYVEQLLSGAKGGSGEEEALGMVSLNVLEELSTDHGDGYNFVRSLGFRRRKERVDFFVDSSPPEPGEFDPSSPLAWTAYP